VQLLDLAESDLGGITALLTQLMQAKHVLVCPQGIRDAKALCCLLLLLLLCSAGCC
jgi:hypothetical protein